MEVRSTLPYIKSNKIRMLLLVISSVTIMLISLLPVKVFEETGLDTVVCFIMCLIYAIGSFNGYFRINKRKKILVSFFIILGVIEFITGLAYGILGHISVGVFYIVMPLLLVIIIDDKRQIEVMSFTIALSSTCVFLIIFFISVLFMPLGTEQYAAFTGNPNSLGSFVVVGLCGTIYLSMKVKNKLSFLLVFIQGIECGFLIFTRSRTAILTAIMFIIIMAVYGIFNKRKKKKIRYILYLFTIIVAIYFSYFSVTTLSYEIGEYNNVALKQNIQRYFNVTLIDVQSDEYMDGQSEIDGEGKEDVSFADAIIAGANRSLKGIADNNSFSSGRFEIWKTFINKIGLLGHGEGTLEINGIEGYNAHNAYIQIAYSFGGIAGIIYIIISIYSAYLLAKENLSLIIGGNFSCENAYILSIFMGYIVYNMLAATVAPFSYWFVLLFAIIVVPNLCIEQKNRF